MKKNGFTLIELLRVIGLSILILAVLFVVGNGIANTRTQSKAVELGMGEYVLVDSTKNATEFRWKNTTTNLPKPWLTTTATNDGETYIINIYKK